MAPTFFFDLLIYFLISLRLALLGSTTKPRKERGVRASPLGDSFEVDRKRATCGSTPRKPSENLN